MFSAPYAVGVQLADGSTKNTGHLGADTGFFNALRGQPGGWANLIQTQSDGTVLRALAPGHGIEAGALQGTVMDDYVNRVWQKYSSSTLTVTPFTDQPNTKYFGRVSGDVMNFTSAGAVVTSFQKPDSDSIFGCYKRLDAPDDLVRGPIPRTLCAGFNRSTLLTNPQPAGHKLGELLPGHGDQQVRHQDPRADGRRQGLRVRLRRRGHLQSLVHDGDPQQAYVTLDPFELTRRAGPVPGHGEVVPLTRSCHPDSRRSSGIPHCRVRWWIRAGSR